MESSDHDDANFITKKGDANGDQTKICNTGDVIIQSNPTTWA